MNRAILLSLLSFGMGLMSQESVTLLDFQKPIPEKFITHRQTSTKWLGPGRFHIHVQPEGPWPGITIFAPEGKWDLSAFQSISVTMKNTGEFSQRFGVRVDNPGGDGKYNCLQDFLTLEPGERGVLTLPIKRKDKMSVKLFGMRGCPVEVGGSMTGETRCVDPSNIVGVLVFAPSPLHAADVEVESIVAHGLFKQEVSQPIPAEKFFPFIDTFGQYIHRDWPGKVKDMADLKSRVQTEERDLTAHPGPSSWDKWGGWAEGPSLKATGFFRTEKYHGKWWLVDPDGKLFFSHGMDCVTFSASTPIEDRDNWFQDFPGKDPAFQEFFGKTVRVVPGYYYSGRQPKTFDFLGANLLRKYGQDWKAVFATLSHRRLRSWGINTIGNWSSPDIYLQHKTPYFVCVNSGGTLLEGSTGYWGKFKDVFDPSFAEYVRKAFKFQVGKSANDPWCIGYFVDNEIGWGTDVSLAVAALQSPRGQAAKKEFVKDLQEKYGQIEKLNEVWGTKHASWEALLDSRKEPDQAKAKADLQAFYTKFAETYFRIIRKALKAVAPNQLYAGCRFAWVNNLAAEAAGKYCDIVSYNLYRRDVSKFEYPGSRDVPLIIGEFHFGALDRGMFHTGLVPTDSQQERANAYKSYVEGVLRHPRFVGCHWFKYCDEATIGRGLDEENYQIGFLDTVDTPYVETIQASRDVGYDLYKYRLEQK
ncbi:MAG: beta-galactosidase [Victivallales bacterium]|nr:beta-galactosidase [Victivallales bacterium]